MKFMVLLLGLFLGLFGIITATVCTLDEATGKFHNFESFGHMRRKIAQGGRECFRSFIYYFSKIFYSILFFFPSPEYIYLYFGECRSTD